MDPQQVSTIAALAALSRTSVVAVLQYMLRLTPSLMPLGMELPQTAQHFTLPISPVLPVPKSSLMRAFKQWFTKRTTVIILVLICSVMLVLI
jgi:hypothetical protein